MAVTTLILGAGLGIEYGFPSGHELRNLIIDELDEHDRELRDILVRSHAETVDEIAARHPRHADTIRRIVIRILKYREDPDRLFQNQKPNTYKQILRQIERAQIKGDKVHVITFNYDRSLQFLLSEHNSIEPKERQIDPSIVHTVYGRLAPLLHEDPNRNRPQWFHHYGAERRPLNNDPALAAARLEHRREREQIKMDDLWQASKISFIGEKNGPRVEHLKPLLESSDQILFLGVGYHNTNMELLGLDFTASFSNKLIAGTGYNLSADHIASIKEQYPAIRRIENCDAHTFIKFKVDFTEPAKNLPRNFSMDLAKV